MVPKVHHSPAAAAQWEEEKEEEEEEEEKKERGVAVCEAETMVGVSTEAFWGGEEDPAI